MKVYLRIIIMASGLSRRFGENKLLVPVNGKPIYSYVIESVASFLKKYPTGGAGIVVSCYDEILIQGEAQGLNPIFNEHASIGQSESIKLGLSFPLNKDHDGIREVAVFLTADQPWMRPETLEKFLLKAMTSEIGFLCCSFNGTPGSPVSFNDRYYHELLQLTNDQGGKFVMRKYPDEVVYLEIDEEELRDVDVPRDLI